MARTNVPILAADVNGTVNQTTAGMTAIDAANNHVFTPDRAARKLLLVVNNTFAGAKVITVKAGANPPANRKFIGDLAISVAQNGWLFQQLDYGRYAQADGTVNVDVAAATTGFITVLGQTKRIS